MSFGSSLLRRVDRPVRCRTSSRPPTILGPRRSCSGGITVLTPNWRVATPGQRGSVAYRVKNSTKERTDKNTLTASRRFHTIWSPIFILRALHSIVSRDATARWVRAVGRPSDQGSVCFDEQGGAIKRLAHSRRRAEGEVRSDSFGGKKRMSRRDSRKFHLSKEAPK